MDRLEHDISDAADLLRLDVRDGLGQQLANEWQVTGVPTFFVLDGSGQVVYRRAGAPDTVEIQDVVADLASIAME